MRNRLYAIGLLLLIIPTLIGGYYTYVIFYEWTEAMAKYELNLQPHGVDRSENPSDPI